MGKQELGRCKERKQGKFFLYFPILTVESSAGLSKVLSHPLGDSACCIAAPVQASCWPWCGGGDVGKWQAGSVSAKGS